MDIRRSERVLTAIGEKLAFLEAARGKGGLDGVPRFLNLSSFADWEDSVRQIRRFGRQVLYSKNPAYVALRQRVEAEIAAIAKFRFDSKPGARRRSEREAISSLPEAFFSQYASLLVEVDSIRKKNLRLERERKELEQRLREAEREISNLRQTLSRVAPLRSV